jgi:hypothetical protein
MTPGQKAMWAETVANLPHGVRADSSAELPITQAGWRIRSCNLHFNFLCGLFLKKFGFRRDHELASG